MIGFLITGAGLPLLGVLAIAYSNSRDIQDLASRAGKAYGIIFSVVLYLAIGPFFVAARNGAVAFDIAIKPFLGADTNQQLVLGVFTVLFFAISYWLSVSLGKLVDRVGKVLTPALLRYKSSYIAFISSHSARAMVSP